VTSALGLLFADVVHDFAVTLVRSVADVDLDELNACLSELEARTRRALSSEGFVPGRQLLERAIERALRRSGKSAHTPG